MSMPPRAATGTTPDAARTAVLTSVVTETREVMWAAGTTEVSDAEIREAERLLAQARRILDRSRRDRVHRVPLTADWIERARAGEPVHMAWLNPLRIPVEIFIDGPHARSTLTPGALHEGPPGCLHGGFAAALLDHVLGVLLAAQGILAFTANLHLDFHRTTLLDIPCELGGEVVSVQGRKVRTRAFISQDGTTTVSGEGLFIQPEGLHIAGVGPVEETGA